MLRDPRLLSDPTAFDHALTALVVRIDKILSNRDEAARSAFGGMRLELDRRQKGEARADNLFQSLTVCIDLANRLGIELNFAHDEAERLRGEVEQLKAGPKP